MGLVGPGLPDEGLCEGGSAAAKLTGLQLAEFDRALEWAGFRQESSGSRSQKLLQTMAPSRRGTRRPAAPS